MRSNSGDLSVAVRFPREISVLPNVFGIGGSMPNDGWNTYVQGLVENYRDGHDTVDESTGVMSLKGNAREGGSSFSGLF